MNKYGFIKVATGVFDVKIGNPSENAKSIKELIKKADEQEVELLVLPELCMTGYSCQDMFLRNDLIVSAENHLGNILYEFETYDVMLVIGMPVRSNGLLFNCAVVALHGEVLAVIPKTYLPNYNEYYEKRWFASACDAVSDRVTLLGDEVPFGTDIIIESDNGIRLSCEICEDLWVNVPPSCEHTLYGANIIANLSASNDIVTKKNYRRELVKMQSAKCNCAYLYSSAGSGESTADIVYGGHQIIASCGNIFAETDNYLLGYEPLLVTSVIDVEKIDNDRIKANSYRPAKNRNYTRINVLQGNIHATYSDMIPPVYANAYPFVPSNPATMKERCQEIIMIQAAGLATRLRKTEIRKSVIGVSGGLDSTLALLVVAKAYEMLGYPTSDIIGITMPGFGTTKQTKNSADALMDLIGTEKRTIDITDACRQHMKDITHPDDLYDVTFENIQARERTQILMDVANQVCGLVIGTGDLSEIALGWCTYNGDHMSMYAVNSSVPKTLVKFLIAEYATSFATPELKKVLDDVCNTKISPELLPPDENGEIKQDTEETIGKYDLHDFFLYYFVRNGFSGEKLLALAKFAFKGKISDVQIEKTLDIFLNRFRQNQFKRNCMPDGPKVGSVALSPRGDWRMPSDM